MAKKLSKRISEKKKTRVAQKNTRSEAKVRREQRRKQRGTTKVPKSYLMLEDEKEHFRSIKEATQQRTQNHQKVTDQEPAYISDLKKCMLEHMCDTYIEIVDFKDIEGSRSKSSESLLKSNGKSIYIFINFNNEQFDIDLSSLQSEGLVILHDLRVLSHGKKFCIFGNRKSGKFLLSKNIEALSTGNLDFEFVRTPSKQPTVSEVFRGHLDLSAIDPIIMFNQAWEFVDQEEIKRFYMLNSFDGSEAFLDVLADKVAKDSSSKKSLAKAALQFLKDVQSGEIAWMKHQDRFHFKFTTNQ